MSWNCDKSPLNRSAFFNCDISLVGIAFDIFVKSFPLSRNLAITEFTRELMAIKLSKLKSYQTKV